MSDKFKNLNDTFNVDDAMIDVKPEKSEIVSVENNSKNKTDILKDYEYTRGNLYSIIEKGQEALNGVLELAQESEMPRAYEVAGQLIKNVADATDKLMKLQKELKEVTEEFSSKNPTNVTNALFVGSTAELAKLLKNTATDNKTK